MKRINLRWFLFVVTAFCILLPPFLYQLLDYPSEQKVWSSFYAAKYRRELAIDEWRTSQKAGANVQQLARASEKYYLADEAVNERFNDIIQMYQLDVGPDGQINAAKPGFYEARKKYAVQSDRRSPF